MKGRFWLKYWILRWQFEVCCCVVRRLLTEMKKTVMMFQMVNRLTLIFIFKNTFQILMVSCFPHVLQSRMLFCSLWLQQHTRPHTPRGPWHQGLTLDFIPFQFNWPWLGPYKLFISLCKKTLNKQNANVTLNSKILPITVLIWHIKLNLSGSLLFEHTSESSILKKANFRAGHEKGVLSEWMTNKPWYPPVEHVYFS